MLELGENKAIKTLGLLWSNKDDKFLLFDVKFKEPKGLMLASIARIFDPLEFLTLCVIVLRIMLRHQKIGWEESWDDKVSQGLELQWKYIMDNLLILNILTIPRYVLCKKPRLVQLHFFSDASENSYEN